MKRHYINVVVKLISTEEDDIVTASVPGGDNFITDEWNDRENFTER